MNKSTPVKRLSFRLVTFLSTILAILIVLLPVPQSIAYAPPVPNLFDTQNTTVNEDVIINITNRERLKNALLPLTQEENLQKAAEDKAEDMILASYFDHYSPSGLSPWHFILNAGYDYSYAGENLAMNFFNSEDIVRAWMESPSHRHNILNPEFQNIGVAVKEGYLNGYQTYLVVQMFGQKRQSLTEKAAFLVFKIRSMILGG